MLFYIFFCVYSFIEKLVYYRYEEYCFFVFYRIILILILKCYCIIYKFLKYFNYYIMVYNIYF